MALFFMGIVALFTSRFSTDHILTIVDSWKRLAKGDFSVRLKARMKDERAQLIHAFNEIVPKIEEHMHMSIALGLAQEVQQSLLPQRAILRSSDSISRVRVYIVTKRVEIITILSKPNEAVRPLWL